MIVAIDVPGYSPEYGIAFNWDEGFEIEMEVLGSEIRLTANQAGLISLARHLLTLAQDDVPSGRHLHLTADQEIEGSNDLIIERRDDWGDGGDI